MVSANNAFRTVSAGANLPPNILPPIYAAEFNGAILSQMVNHLKERRAHVIQCEVPIPEEVKSFVYDLRERIEFHVGTSEPVEMPRPSFFKRVTRALETKAFINHKYFHSPERARELFARDFGQKFDADISGSAVFQAWRKVMMVIPEAVAEAFPESTLVRIDEWGGIYTNRRTVAQYDFHSHDFYSDTSRNADSLFVNPQEHRAGYYLNLAQAEDGTDFEGSDGQIYHGKGWLYSLFTTSYHPQGPCRHDVPTATEALETRHKRSTEIAKIYPSVEQ